LKQFVSFSAVVGVAGAVHWAAQGVMSVALVLVGAVVVLTGARLTLLASNPAPIFEALPSLPVSIPSRGTVVPVVLVVLIISSVVVPAGPVGMAAAETDVREDDCTKFEDAIYTVTSGALGQFPECRPSRLSDEIDELQNESTQKTHSDIYSAMSTQEDTFESALAQRNNYVQDSRTQAYLKAENVTVQAMLNESGAGSPTLSELNTTAENAAVDYYTESHQYADVNIWNKHILGLKYAFERAENESDLSSDDVMALKFQNGTGYMSDQGTDRYVRGFNQTNITLANGTTREVWQVQVYFEYSDPSCFGAVNTSVGPRTGPIEVQDSSCESPPPTLTGVKSLQPDGSSLDNFTFVNHTRVANRFDETSSAADLVADNARVNAKSMYDAENNGTFDPSNYSNPYALAQEYATDYNSTGYWSYAMASGAALGYRVADLNGTSLMYVKYGDTTYEGQIMSPNGPTSTTGWQVNHTYNPDNIDGTQWLMRSDGNLTKLTGNFEITRMTGENGEEINQTKTVKYVYKNDDSSDLERRHNLTMDLVREINEDTTTDGGGGCTSFCFEGDGSGPSKDQLILGVAVVLAAVALTRR
jgi:hypothetical protein